MLDKGRPTDEQSRTWAHKDQRDLGLDMLDKGRPTHTHEQSRAWGPSHQNK